MRAIEPITDAEGRKRQEAVNYAHASVDLEGFNGLQAGERVLVGV